MPPPGHDDLLQRGGLPERAVLQAGDGEPERDGQCRAAGGSPAPTTRRTGPHRPRPARYTTGRSRSTGPTTVEFFSTDLAGHAEQVNTQQIQDQTVVSLTFDDQCEDQWLYAWPLMQQYNMTGTFYVITSDTDAGYPCCMSWSQLDTLQADGNDIGSHTIDHPDDLTTMTLAQQTQEICGSRQDMINNGIPDPESFAYPDGNYTTELEGVVRQCGFNNARTGGGISNSNTVPSRSVHGNHPAGQCLCAAHDRGGRGCRREPAGPRELRQCGLGHGGGWLPITFHDVCDANASDYSDCMSKYGSVEDQIFGQFLAWLAAAGPTGRRAGWRGGEERMPGHELRSLGPL